MEEDAKENKRFPFWKLLRVFLVVFVVWVLCWIAITYFLGEWSVRGNFGDMFGAVSSLFSGLAFAAFYVALHLQNEELSLQRKELRQTREELKGQREQLEAQNRTFQQQRFENTFFHLLKLHHDFVDRMDAGGGRGRGCFRQLYNELFSRFKPVEGMDDRGLLNRVYSEAYRGFDLFFGPYFENFMATVKFVESSSVTEKEFYMDLVRAQLSGDEAIVLFLHTLSGPERENALKPLIERNGLLRSMPRHIGLNQPFSQYDDRYRALFDKKAFGESD